MNMKKFYTVLIECAYVFVSFVEEAKIISVHGIELLLILLAPE